MLSELGLVSQIRRRASTQATNSLLRKGIGDDCAILRPRPKHELVFTTDFALEGRHFTLATHKSADIGHKALARSLSDLAAMGSRPLFCLVSLAVPQTLGKRFVDGFYRGLLQLAARYQITLAGGDLASFDRVIVDVMCCGEVRQGKALLRSTAKAGDGIYVSGMLGASAAGFEAGKGANFRRHLRPEPRIEVGQALSRLGVTCCMDLSDGLALDLRRLCLESKVGAVLKPPLPVAPGADTRHALSGGEDYELLFTAPAKVRIPRVIEGIPVTRIGTITKEKGGKVTLAGRPLKASGFDHFSNAATDSDGGSQI